MIEQALINSAIISWARQRVGLSEDTLAQKLKVEVQKILDWESGKSKPTFQQAQNIAKKTNIPFGYLYLDTPPLQEDLAIPDLRTIGSRRVKKVSDELRDIINQVMVKQEWYRDYLIQLDAPRLNYIGKFNLKNANIFDVVTDIRNVLNLKLPQKGNQDEYYKYLVTSAEHAHILVMKSGIVGNNTKRKLEVSEFRGFAICDDIAPLIFINGSDAPAAQIFTFVHELAHLWIGKSGISDLEENHVKEEKFCNAVAGEFLLPQKDLMKLWQKDRSLEDNFIDIASRYHISKLVVARRALDCKLITSQDYESYYSKELKRFKKENNSGGDYYRASGIRNGKLFSSAIVSEALSGRMLLRDAGKLLGVQPSKIEEFARKLAL